MRDVILCDRCGKQVRKGVSTRIIRDHICEGDWLPDTVFNYDLCPKCMAMVEAWIQGKAKIVQEKSKDEDVIE